MSQPQHMKADHTTQMGLPNDSDASDLKARSLSSPMKRTLLGCLIGTVVILILQIRAGGTALALLSSLFYSVLFSLTVLWAVYWIGGEDDDRSFSWSPVGKMALKAAVFGIALEAGTLFGSPFHSLLSIQDWSIKQTLLWMCIAFFILTLIYSLKKAYPDKHTNAIIRGLRTALPRIALSLMISILLGISLQHPLDIPFSYLFCFFFFACTMVLFLIFAYRQNASIEWFFLIISLCMGLSMSILLPKQTYVSWDDETHYDYTVAMSYLLNPAYDQADILLAARHTALELPNPADAVNGSIATSEIKSNEQEIDSLDNKDAVEMPGFLTIKNTPSLRYDCIAYAPAAMGLWLGRLLHVSASACVLFGRIANLFYYIAICFFAIRLIPIKKVLMACIALLPTSVFLAASFSTDSFIICMSLLSISLIMKYVFSPSTGSIWPFIGIFFTMLIACAPKAVYFPLICLVLLIPAKNYPSIRLYKWLQRCLLIVLGLVFIGLVMLALKSQGDMRGGTDVDIQKQLQFIFHNPLNYGLILTNFLFTQYLNPSSSYGYSLFYAYLGDYAQISTFFTSLIPLIILVVSCMDSNRLSEQLANWKVRIFTLLIVMLLIILIVTSLYLTFTPVGSETIQGCQPRYLLPLIFPATALCFNWRITNNMNARSFACATTTLMGVLGLIGLWFLVLPMGL